jgi:histidine triad (HIT) family protein
MLEGMTEANCIFCKIANGEIPTEIIFQSEQILAFNDIAPEAAIHALIIPKKHFRDVADLTTQDKTLAAELLAAATELAEQLTDGNFKLQFNTGAEAGQTIFHVHAHLLSNSPRKLT